MTGQLAVLGSPIAHSKSPAIHTAAYRVLGLDWHYGRRECDVAGLEPLLAGLDERWIGLSLTMPLKEEAFRLAASRTRVASDAGVVNTLVRTPDGWHGANTDVGGLLLALEEAACDLSDTLILGAGATAVSAVLAAKRGGATRIRVQARRPEAARQLAERFDVIGGTLGESFTPNDTPTTVISTLPGPAGEQAPIDASLFAATLFDVAYDPWPSPLTSRWQAHGGVSVPGINMLIYQALLQIRWFVNGDELTPLEHETELLLVMREAARS